MSQGANARGTSEGDTELVEAALGDGPGARRRLAERLLDVIHREVVFVLRRHAASVGRDPGQEAGDMVQEVLVSLFERDARELRRWDPQRGRSLDSFVRLVARRRVARILGQQRGNPWAELPRDPQTIDDDPAAMHEAEGLARQLEQRDELGAVLDALYARMNERDAELFDLLFVRELEPGEVAEALGMTRQAVNAWSYRTRKLARSLILGDPRRASSSTREPPSKEKLGHG
ncbi:sigma-70 family RNA polymerase sigma factor [Pseudenhygromyxa sp. WMMC2535]|uniref:sigma-70 family RNA polymerase sigma factor n=1 Tax=Pseudenhygromyxa sp. WMMC2535 TaxID=2712867 RepID=UPI001551D332|nr:sigma-70 family RNA polymerase sigma factor [Pseudenhygromyxa sp. WMMC2535]NVB42778.1 sigma-70 family RNA polymerase sigma factor [Pseudenhygromyxa sp. WMMC2535]